MRSRSIHKSLSILVVAGAAALAGCTSDVAASDEGEEVLQSAEALSAESGDADPVEDAVVSDTDIDEAAGEASEGDVDAPDADDVGCGLRKTLRARIKDHFDKNGDGKLDADERADIKDAIGGHPRMKIALVRLGIKARHHVFKRIVWAYDVDGSGSLDASEREALSAAVQARCEARKARILANHDTDGDGKLDDGELRKAVLERMAARRAKAREFLSKFDANGDGKLDETERKAARAALVMHYRSKRDEVKDKYDANDDGKLDDAEIAALKADIRARFEKTAPAE